MNSIICIKNGLSSVALNFFHIGACKIANLTGYFDATYHANRRNYYFAKGWNAFYKLIESKKFIYAFSSDSKILITTKNVSKIHAHDKVAWSQIVYKIKKYVQMEKSSSYVEIDLKKNDKSLNGGVCLGIVQSFIYRYYQEIAQGLSFQEAAIKSAKLFEQGAGLFPSTVQVLHNISQVHNKKFDDRYPVEKYRHYERTLLKTTARDFFGNHFLGAKQFSIAAYDSSSALDLERLKDGAYEIISGGRRIDGAPSTSRRHATALLVHKKSFFIFDPNLGLFNHSEPSCYYDILRKERDEILFSIHVEY